MLAELGRDASLLPLSTSGLISAARTDALAGDEAAAALALTSCNMPHDVLVHTVLRLHWVLYIDEMSEPDVSC